jgi:hypothetical protein
MTFDIEIVLRHEKDATIQRGVHARDPREWTENDVREILTEMLLAVNRVKNPDAADPSVALRGFSWIVEPFDGGGVVIALEIPMGAAVAGPFAIDPGTLDRLVQRAMTAADDRPEMKVH